MAKYKVYVELRAGEDDTMVFEYDGVEYSTREEAKRIQRAVLNKKDDGFILDCWVEKVEE